MLSIFKADSIRINLKFMLKDKVEFWSCNCIVKETLWN